MSRSEPPATATRLKRWALEAGFDRAGIARLGPSEHGEALSRWLEDGRHAGMQYLARRLECRLDPAELVPWARSVLCVAQQYADESSDDAEGDLWPRVARYARGRDYHDLMGERLAAVGRRVEEAFGGVRTRWYVDTGPVLERELAARAGLGAFGKNTNLLHPEAGSYFFLGEMFLELDLEPDTPIADLCGSCTACLEACPTGALPEPYLLDSNRCISYWNIEHRGSIPEAKRDVTEGWVFGCDVCQEVCPWNAEPAAAPPDELRLGEEKRRLGLVELLLLGRDEYVEIFRGSPMKRAKREGLQRSAALAMAGRGDGRYIPALAEALSSGSEMVREHAAWALASIGGEEARAALTERLPAESDDSVLSAIREALARP